jgi:NADH dehydrogenase/NADH:ubiquinone oxidoreductase subunit G
MEQFMVTITIDDRQYQAEAGTRVIEVARANDVPLPTLCYHPSLKPSGSCRLCAVEVASRSSGRQVTMLACVLKVKDGMVIKTQS